MVNSDQRSRSVIRSDPFWRHDGAAVDRRPNVPRDRSWPKCGLGGDAAFGRGAQLRGRCPPPAPKRGKRPPGRRGDPPVAERRLQLPRGRPSRSSSRGKSRQRCELIGKERAEAWSAARRAEPSVQEQETEVPAQVGRVPTSSAAGFRSRTGHGSDLVVGKTRRGKRSGSERVAVPWAGIIEHDVSMRWASRAAGSSRPATRRVVTIAREGGWSFRGARRAGAEGGLLAPTRLSSAARTLRRGRSVKGVLEGSTSRRRIEVISSAVCMDKLTLKRSAPRSACAGRVVGRRQRGLARALRGAGLPLGKAPRLGSSVASAGSMLWGGVDAAVDLLCARPRVIVEAPRRARELAARQRGVEASLAGGDRPRRLVRYETSTQRGHGADRAAPLGASRRRACASGERAFRVAAAPASPRDLIRPPNARSRQRGQHHDGSPRTSISQLWEAAHRIPRLCDRLATWRRAHTDSLSYEVERLARA